MKVLYLAGPITNASLWARKANIDNGLRVARNLWTQGYAVICPHANTYFMDGPEIPVGVFYVGDIEIMLRCDALVLMPGWDDSKGCQGEYDAARKASMTIYYWNETTERIVLMEDLGGHTKAPRW